MKVVQYMLCFISACMFWSCNEEIDFVSYEPQFIVEGRIESGGYASVLLSTSVSFVEPLDTTNLLSHTVRNAKVTISNGEEEEILMLKTNDRKIPPYEYVTTKMRGEVGKHYHLRIEYNDQLITATTYIPEPVELDRVWFKKKNETDRFGYVYVQFKNSSDHNYQISTQQGSERNVFIPCFYGNIDRALYAKDEVLLMQINKGPVIFPESDYDISFADSLSLRVKLSTQTQESFNFWSDYQNEIVNSQNPIFPASDRLRSNIKGGRGIWAGYGVSIKKVL